MKRMISIKKMSKKSMPKIIHATEIRFILLQILDKIDMNEGLQQARHAFNSLDDTCPSAKTVKDFFDLVQLSIAYEFKGQDPIKKFFVKTPNMNIVKQVVDCIHAKLPLHLANCAAKRLKCSTPTRTQEQLETCNFGVWCTTIEQIKFVHNLSKKIGRKITTLIDMTDLKSNKRDKKKFDEIKSFIKGVKSKHKNKCRLQWKCASCNRLLLKKKTCGRCRMQWYCGNKCQKKHWKKHKAECKAV